MKMDKDFEKTQMGNLTVGLNMRAQAKLMETEVKEIKKEANEMIEAAMSMLGIDKYSVEGIGTLRLMETTRSSLNKDKMITSLVSQGVGVDIINNAVEEATKETTFTSVEFRDK